MKKLGLLATGLLAIFTSGSLQAASSSWAVNADGAWSLSTNWAGGTIPGATSGTTSTDIATFAFTLTALHTVTVDPNRNIGGITFTNPAAFGYTLSGGNLRLTNGGVILVSNGVTGSYINTISSAVEIQGNAGSATFSSNGFGGGGGVLSIGGAVTGVSTSGNTTTLTLNGSHTGVNLISGIIGDGAGGGNLAINKSGAGTWSLTGANTYTGKTSIGGGILTITSLNSVNGGSPLLPNSSLGRPTTVANGTIDLNGGVLSYAGAAETTDRVINLGGNGLSGGIDAGGTGLLKFTSNLAATGTGNKTLFLTASSNSGGEFSGIISDGSGVTSVFKLGSGTSGWTLSGANTYTGKTSLTGNIGPLKVSSINSVVGGTASSSLGAPVTIANGTIDIFSGALTYTGAGETTDRVINLAGVTGVPIIDQSGTGLLKFTSNLTSTGNGSKTLTLQGNTAGTGELAGIIVDNSTVLGNSTSLNKNGSGTWTVSGANTFTGKTSIQNGTLKVSSINSVVGGTASSSLGAPVTIANGTIDMGLTNTGGTLVYTGTGETTDRVINMAGATGFNTLDQSGSGLLKFTSNMTVTGLGLKGIIFQGSTGGTGEFAGSIVDNSLANYTSVTKNGTGSWTLSGVNTYTGGTTVNAGTLTLSGANNNTGVITINAGTLAISGSGTFGASTNALTNAAGTVDLGGTSQTVGAVLLSGAGATIQNGNLTGSSYTATNTSGTATVSASLQGTGALNRTGAGGTLALTGANTYTGATNVSAGTLSLNGSGTANNSSGYVVNGGTLSLDNTSTSLERLNNSANVTLSAGANLNVTGNSSSASTETIANLGFDNGNSIVTVTAPGTPLTTLAATGGLLRSNNATGLVRGTNLGQAGSSAGLITLGTAPSGANFVGAGGSPTGTGTIKNLAIVPWLVGGSTVASNGSAFVTYDTTGGLRALVAGEVDALSAAYATTGNNVGQTSTLALTTTGHTFNSLFITGAANLTGNGAGDSLTISSGALANTSNTTISGFGSGINFGNGEGIITSVAGTMTVSNSIAVSSSGGLTKAGAGVLLLTGPQAYTGATTVNQGTLTLGNGTTDATLSSSGINTVVGGTTNFANVSASTFSGALSGGGAFTKTGAGLLTLGGSGAGTGTGAGTLTITVGGVRLSTATALQNTTASLGMTSALTFNTGITNFTIGGLAGSSALALQDTGAAAIALQVGNNNASTSYSGILSGGGSLVKIGTGTLTLSGVNTFTGGLTIKNGTVIATTSLNALGGTGAVTLGDSAANTNATLGFNVAGTWNNPITLASTTTGTLTIADTSNVAVVVNGTVTGNNNLTIDHRNNNTLTFNTVNNAGSINHSGLSTGATVISTVGSNVSAVTQDSSSSALTLTTLNVKSGGTTTLTNNNSSATRLTVTNSVTGTGNLVLNNNGTNVNGILLSGGASHTGTITNSGTGTAAVTISGNIASSVSSVVQNSATSGLILSGTNTFGGMSILSGTLTGTAASSLGSGTILLGASTGSANATLLAGNTGQTPLTFTNNITAQANTGSGILTIGSVPGANTLTFSGTLTLGKDVVLDSAMGAAANGNSTGIMNFSQLAGSKSVTITSSGLGTSSSGQAYGLGGSNVTFTAANNSWSGDTRIASGALILSSTVAGSSNAWLGTGTNALIIGDTSGSQSSRFLLFNSGVGQTFSKNITVEAGNSGISAIGSTSTALNFATYSSAISLKKSAYLTGFNTFTGAISKDVTAPGAVSLTTLAGPNVSSTSLLTIGGSAKTYDGGTTVGQGVLAAATGTTGNFGTGNVVVETGVLRITDTANLANTKKVLVGSLGQLTIGAAGLTQANLVALVDSASSGAIGLANGITYTTNLDLSTIGNGYMTLGNEALGVATYSGSLLGANIDGDYRLGWGNSTTINALNITNAVVVDGLVGGSPHAAKLIIGGSQGHIGIALTQPGIHTEGFVSLNAANTYTGGTVVNSRSRLQGQAFVSGSPFGSTTGTMTLHNSTLVLNNNATLSTSATVGALDFDGYSNIQVNAVTGVTNTLTVASVTRNNNGTLVIGTSGIGGVLASTAILKSTSAPSTFATVDTGSGTIGMLAPYFTDASGNYLSYNATTGFTPITTTWTTLGGATPTNAYVKTSTAGTSASNIATYVDGNATVGALSLGGSLFSSVIGDVTVTIASGGLNAIAYGNNAVFNSGLSIGSAGNNKLNLDFNGKEAVIITNPNNQNGGMTIFNNIGNTGGLGLTKSGTANLNLGSTANTFTGTVTINQGAITITADGGLGNSSNGVLMNGGLLYANTSGTLALAASRTLTLGEAGGGLGVGSGTSQPNTAFGAGNMTVLGQITGTGAYFGLYGSNNALNSGSSNTFTLSNTSNNFVAPIFVGSNLAGRVNLAFSDDAQLGNSANTVTLMNGNSSLQYVSTGSGSTGRGVIFADMGGSIEIFNNVTLTDSGTISGSGMFNKNGIGTLALTGSGANFSGTVNVNAGVLRVSNADALGATTAAITGSSGVSGGAAYVQSGAALEVQGNVALGNAGGKTMYLNGTGISNGGALRNVSGNNSNTGAVIMQTGVTGIGADTGSKLTLSGPVSGATLNKVGGGTLEFTASNTYTGGTNVVQGVLLVNNTVGSGTGTSSVTVSSGALLAGTGSSSGAVTLLAGGKFSAGNIVAGVSTADSYDGTSLTWNSDNTTAGMLFDLGTSSDLLTLSGAFNKGSGSTFIFNFENGVGFGVGTYNLVNFGSTSFSLSDFSYTTTTPGVVGVFALNANNLEFQVTAIPEPSTYAMLASGLGVLWFLRRKKSV